MGIRLMGVVFGLAAVTALFGNPAVAACIMIPPLSFEGFNRSRLNPQSIIPSPGTDGPAVAASTRDLAATEPQLAADLVHVAQTAQARFQGAMAAGPAQAALTCLGVDQQAALRVEGAVAGFEDSRFQALFTAVVGDLSTAATSPVFPAATGSAGSVGITNPHRSVRSAPGPDGGGASSTNTPSVFGVATLNQSARTDCASSSKFDALHERAGAMRRT
jgi:hypothetical protein